MKIETALGLFLFLVPIFVASVDVKPTPSVPSMNCSGRADSYYPNPNDPCSSLFFACVGGLAFPQSCPNLFHVFDVSTKSCTWKPFVQSCTVATPADLSPPDRPAATSIPGIARVISGVNVDQDLHLDCRSKKDGYYPNPMEPCSSVYFVCVSGVSIPQFCGSMSLAFDVDSQSCAWKVTLKVCQASMSVIVATLQSKSSTSPLPSSTTATRAPSGPDGTAGALPLVFDEPTGSVATEAPSASATEVSTIESTGTAVTSLLPVVTDSTIMATTASPKASKDKDGQRQGQRVPEMDCTMKRDGHYKNPKFPCSTIYFACVAGSAVPEYCPAPSMAFDEASQSCTWKKLLGRCQHGPVEPSVAPTSLTSSLTTTAATTTKTTATVRSTTASSTTGPAASVTQPRTTAPTRVSPMIKATAPAAVPKVTVTMESAQSLGQTTATMLVENDSSSDDDLIDCGTVTEDTYHADPTMNCSNRFFVCVPWSNRSHPFSCPPNMFYDPTVRRCDIFEMVPACTGKEFSKNEFTVDCTNKADGNYAIKDVNCPRWFVKCFNRQSFFTACPGNLRYSAEMEKCTGENEVKSCQL